MKFGLMTLALAGCAAWSLGCSDTAGDATGFEIAENYDLGVPTTRDCGSSNVLCFETECIDGRGVISFDIEQPSRLEMRNTCSDRIALHWITGHTDEVSDHPVQTFDVEGDFTVPYSADRSVADLGVLSLFKFHLRDGSTWDNDPLNRRQIDFNYDLKPHLSPQQVMALVDPDAEVVIEGDAVRWNDDLRNEEGLNAFTQLEEHGLEAVAKVEVLVPAVTRSLTPLPEDQVPWPVQLAFDDGATRSGFYSIRWTAFPDYDDPRPRQLVTVDLISGD